MKYEVVGANRDTGARMTLQFEAESKAAAERKASQSGMTVHHVRDISEGAVATSMPPRARRKGGGSGMIVKLIVLLAILAAAYYFVLPMFR